MKSPRRVLDTQQPTSHPQNLGVGSKKSIFLRAPPLGSPSPKTHTLALQAGWKPKTGFVFQGSPEFTLAQFTLAFQSTWLCGFSFLHGELQTLHFYKQLSLLPSWKPWIRLVPRFHHISFQIPSAQPLDLITPPPPSLDCYKSY